MVDSLRLALAPSSSSSSGKDSVALQPLSQRLHRLWTERGDFSKFSLADLHDEDEDEADEDDAKDQHEDAEDEPGRRITIGWAPGEEEGAAAEQKDDEKEGDGAGSSAALETKPMSMEDFVALKEEMIGKLSIAQQSLYSSQALVSLLVAGHRSRTSLLQSSHLDPSSSKVTPSNAASRAPSPGAASSTGSDGGRGTPAAQRSQPTAAGSQGPPPGSAAAVEAEFGLEPASVALTAIDRVEVKKKKPQTGEEDDEEAVAERERVDPASSLVFASDAERDEYARRTQLVLAQKRQTMRSVVDILRAGARLLDDSASQDEAESSAAASSSASRQHWAALREAQARGWGITPGRPGKSAYHARQRRADEGEQDAWIGFAVPEARTVYARRGLAYVARDDDGERKGDGEESPGKGGEAEAAASTSAATSSAVKLIFPSRVSKRFRVSLVTLDPTTGATLSRSVSSLSTSLDDGDAGDSAIDAQLRQAQRELTDRELFDDVAAEARLLASQGIVACESKDDSVLVKLAGEARAAGTKKSSGSDGQLAMLLEMVDESSSKDDDNDGTSSTSPTPPASASSSHYVALLDSMMRLGLVRRYQQRASAAAAAAKAEAEANAGKDKSRPNAPPSSAGGKASRPTTSQPDSTASSTAKRPKLDPWTHAPTLMPLIALLHYASFLFQVRSVVQGALNGNKEKVDLKGELEMHPAQSIANAAVWLREVLDPVVGQRGDGAVGSSSQGGAAGEAAATATRRAIASLRGSATVTIEVPDPPTSDPTAPAPPPANNSDPPSTKRIVIAHLTLSYPSHLSVQLPWRTTLSGQLGVTMHGVDVQGGGGGGERTLRGLLEEEIRGAVKRQGGGQ